MYEICAKTENNGLFQIFHSPPPSAFKASYQLSHPALNWWSFDIFHSSKWGPTFLRATMPSSTLSMFHSTKKTRPTDFLNFCERELINKNPISFNSSGGVPRNRSRNFNHRHHHHLGMRKSQRMSNKRRRTCRTSELVFMTQNVQGLKQDFTNLDILTHYIEKQTWKSQASITFLSECRLKILPCTGSQHHDFDTIIDDLTHLIEERECKKGSNPS